MYYESIETVVSVTPLRLQATRHLTLTAPYTARPALMVSFDGWQMQPIAFPDGVVIENSPEAIAVSGAATSVSSPHKMCP